MTITAVLPSMNGETGIMEAFVNNKLKGVWVASAEVEMVRGDLDRAKMALREAIVEAMIAG